MRLEEKNDIYDHEAQEKEPKSMSLIVLGFGGFAWFYLLLWVGLNAELIKDTLHI